MMVEVGQRSFAHQGRPEGQAGDWRVYVRVQQCVPLE